VNWDGYMVLARGLAGSRFEAWERSAASRAYYAAFNVSRRWLEANVMPIDHRGAHGQVWQTFRIAERASPATRRDWILVGRLGQSLRILRNEADYSDIVPELDGRVVHALRDAERILALLPKLELTD
jgi:hypothetical protein